jgi:hypothetical protein
VSQGARRLTLLDESQTLFATDDAHDPAFDWAAHDEQLQLQLSVLPRPQLHSLTLRTEHGLCTVDAVTDTHELFVATLWAEQYSCDDVQRRSFAIARQLNSTLARLRTEGARHG